MIEEDEFIEKQIGQYHKEQIRKIYPDSGCRFALAPTFKIEVQYLRCSA